MGQDDSLQRLPNKHPFFTFTKGHSREASLSSDCILKFVTASSVPGKFSSSADGSDYFESVPATWPNSGSFRRLSASGTAPYAESETSDVDAKSEPESVPLLQCSSRVGGPTALSTCCNIRNCGMPVTCTSTSDCDASTCNISELQSRSRCSTDKTISNVDNANLRTDSTMNISSYIEIPSVYDCSSDCTQETALRSSGKPETSNGGDISSINDRTMAGGSSSEDDDGSANASGYTRRKSRIRSANTSAVVDVCPEEVEDVPSIGSPIVCDDNSSVPPNEFLKTLLAFLFLLGAWTATTMSLAIVHDRVPDGLPLPDVILDNIPYQSWGLDASEGVITFCVISALSVALNHQHRSIILRRIFLLVGLHYFYRSITFQVTVLPKSDIYYHCAQKSNTTVPFLVIVQRALKVMSGFGMSMNGQHVYCGDFIYSGHTMTLVSTYLIISEYSPRRWVILHWLYFCISFSGIVFLIMGRGHYSIDVIVAYWITTRLWWLYHTVCNHNGLRSGRNDGENQLRRIWWWFIFMHFEGNVMIQLPERYGITIQKTKDASKEVGRMVQQLVGPLRGASVPPTNDSPA